MASLISDRGTINGIQVVYVHKDLPDKARLDHFDILHCFDENEPAVFKEGDTAILLVERATRILYSRMHTAGHLLAETVKELFPELEAYHGNHDPEDGYVKFKMLKDSSLDKDELIRSVQLKLHQILSQDLPVMIKSLPSGMRGIFIGDKAMACGGTHVKCISEIGSIQITGISVNIKEKVITIKYSL